MPERIDPEPGQESVWDYPRPPALERVTDRIQVVFNDELIADTTGAYRVLETSHPPVYYLPPEDINMERLEKTGHRTLCEFKGQAVYYTVRVGDRTAERATWGYPNPTERFQEMQNYLAFYASKMDTCRIGDEEAYAQEGDFYGGWITDDIVGPFKGGPGTVGW